MLPRLVAITGPLRGSTVPVPAGTLTVGAEPANAITLLDAAVSGEHCVLERTGERLTIRDVDPANPTFVNGLPAGERALADGDRIQIGASLFVLRLDDRPAAAEVVAVDERPA